MGFELYPKEVPWLYVLSTALIGLVFFMGFLPDNARSGRGQRIREKTIGVLFWIQGVCLLLMT